MDDHNLNDVLANAKIALAEENDFINPSFGNSALNPDDKIIDSLEAAQAGLEQDIVGIESLDNMLSREQKNRGIEPSIDNNIEMENER